MCPRDCFFCLKRILIFIYNIYNTYYKNIYIIYSIYTSVILESWTDFLPSGLIRWPSYIKTVDKSSVSPYNQPVNKAVLLSPFLI